MKILKYLFFLILIFIIGASIYIATKKSDFVVERTRTFHAPQELVYSEVNDYTTWRNWLPWAKSSGDMIIEYGEKTSGEGGSFSWRSDEIGEGDMKTIKANPYSEIHQQLRIKTSLGQSVSEVYWEFEKQKDSTLITWGMRGEHSFMEKLAFIFHDQSVAEMMSPKFEEGLDNLENQIREKMQSYSINVDGITQHSGGYYMYMATASRITQVQDKIEAIFSDVNTYMEENSIERSGKPFVLYNQWNENQGTAIYSAGYFTPAQIITPEDSPILSGSRPAQRVLKAPLKGDYSNLKEAWAAAYTYIDENGLIVDEESQAFEVYLTGPNDNANPAKWVTQLYIPLQPEDTQEND